MHYKEDNIDDTQNVIDHNHTDIPKRWVNSHSDGTHSHKKLPNKWK